jgi:CRISPR-associated endonuclease/helicase Cas3
VVGHHGRPVEYPEGSPIELFGKAAAQAACTYVEAICTLLTPPSLPVPDPIELARQSWLLAGLCVLADWLGSNQVWFPYQENQRWSIEDYWNCHAARQAEKAVVEAGILPSPVSSTTGFKALTQLRYDPTPVQSWAESVMLPGGPLLILIEDMTGSGKTEAALILAHRLMAAGRARGLYLALPTMATANAMFARLQDCYRRMFAPEARPSLVLSHGRTRDDPRFRASIVATADRALPARQGNSEEADSASECPAWLADDRRKAFLTDIGAGTIDQALLAVLPAKHQSLRLLGLSRQVLIVDEAHAYDAYMGTELDRLVGFQAALGGHTVILSATLPAETKQRLATAYYRALDPNDKTLPEGSYPSVTLLSPAEARTEPKPPRADLRRQISVRRISGIEAAVQRIAAAARAGATVGWIRNTVDDAIAAQSLLRDAGLEAGLFHARFAFGDRYVIEEDVVHRFGKQGSAEDRRGRVLVATQVIEQSLDLDFDLIISDLAPIDLLLQRAGRLWRHPGRQRPIIGPELAILSPDPDGPVTADWIKALLPKTGTVYADHVLLWRSAKLLLDADRIRVPEDVKALIEGAYGPDCERGAPEALTQLRQKAVGDAKAERSFAEQNLLRLEPGYSLGNDAWRDEMKVMTRLGNEMRILRLARWNGEDLEPWCDDPDPRRAWALSEVTVRSNRLSGVPAPTGRLREAVDAARLGWGRYDEDKILLPLSPGDDHAWVGSVLSKGNEVSIQYSPFAGLVFDANN